MNAFNITKSTSSKIKDVSLTLVLIGSLMGATLSTSANAAPAASVENAVSNFVVAQGEKMMVELNTQLEQSIDKEIKALTASFSLDSAVNWLAADEKVKQATTNEEGKVAAKVKTANKPNNE